MRLLAITKSLLIRGARLKAKSSRFPKDRYRRAPERAPIPINIKRFVVAGSRKRASGSSPLTEVGPVFTNRADRSSTCG